MLPSYFLSYPVYAAVAGSFFADGFASASIGVAQFPNLLTGYAVRPVWHVAGADYAVGVDSGVSLTAWTALSQAGLTTVGSQVQMTGTPLAVTVQNVDFSVSGGCYLRSTVSGGSLTVINCKFGGFQFTSSAQNFVSIQTGYHTLKMDKCTIDGSQYQTASGAIGFQGDGVLSVQRVYAFALDQHFIEMVSGNQNVSINYNLIYNVGVISGAHGNILQQSIVGASTSIDFSYNTFVSTPHSATPGEGVQFWPNAGPILNVNCAYNVMIASGPSGLSASYLVHGSALSGVGINTLNYFDTRGAFGAYYPGSMISGNGWGSQSNLSLIDGSTITPA